MHIVWDLHLLKPPSSQAIKSHPGKAKSYEPKALIEIMLSMGRKKSITISHSAEVHTNFHPHFNQRERMGT